MLRSQLVKHNFLRRRQIFLGELLLVSILFHSLFFFFLLVVYSGYRYTKHITVRRNGALLPTYFVSPATMIQSKKVSKQNSTNIRKVIGTVAKKIPSTVIKNDATKKTVAKQQQKKQSIQNKKQQVAQKQKPKEEEKKIKQQQKQEVAKKQQSPQKEGEEQKMNSVKSEEIASPVQQPIIAGAGAIPIAEVDDSDTLKIEQYIQNEISRFWHPPIGLSDDLTCKIRVQINSSGAVSDAVIEESSGVLVYDLSARLATNSLLLPCWAWGKEFTINFR
jgi:outer membrane biosynthesis protein TonB